MSSSEFKREERYYVIKIKDLDIWQKVAVMRLLADTKIKTKECVVVESDWPEYEPVWQMIEARMTGKDAPTQQEAEPVVPWDKFPAYLIEHCEGDVIMEEGLQHALANMLRDPQYCPPKPAALPQPEDELRENFLLAVRCLAQLWDYAERNGITAPEFDAAKQLLQYGTIPQPVASELPGMWDRSDLIGGATDCEPVASVPQDKEKLAQWMLSRSIATGHGDTIDGLIKELDSQVVVKSVRQDVREFIYTKANSAAQFGDQQDVILVSDFEAFMAQRDEAKKLPQDAEQFANDVAEWSQTQFEDVIRVSHFREFMRQRDAGFVMVPVEPTEAMLAAMLEAFGSGAGSCGEHTGNDISDARMAYEAALTASKEGV